MAEPVKRTLAAVVPVELEFPAPMEGSLRRVLEGEYDAPFAGHELTVLDVGANVGAFTLWAHLRWPGSTFHAYEPHPETFEILTRNVGHLPKVTCEQAAVYPGGQATGRLISRYPGDGEAGLVEAMAGTWRELPGDRTIEVPVVGPEALPAADVVKIDAEGSEAAIVEGMDLEPVSLLLLEYQHAANLRRILRVTEGRFELVRHDAHPWSALLGDPEYRRELRGDRYGTVVLARPGGGRLRRAPPVAARPLRERLRALRRRW